MCCKYIFVSSSRLAKIIIMKRLLSAIVVLALSFLVFHSQLLTWTPAFPKDNDNITITVDATKGNQGLLGFSGNVYVHVGVITSAKYKRV